MKETMASAEAGTRCPRCGTPLRPDRLGGLCPRCVTRTALRRVPVAASPHTPAPLGLRLGHYELLAELGRGAMGAVYRARDTRLGRDVALKVILAGQFASEAERRRFLAEAEHTAHFDHPNIVPLYEAGETDGRAWFAMKLVEGKTLAEHLKDLASTPGQTTPGTSAPARASFSKIASLVATVARAVQHAHERGVLHRDLKPGNILLDRDGQPHVTDFGLSRKLGLDSSLTLTGSPVGTPAYMAPEQVAGSGVPTTSADLYSLGAVLYELLAGQPPFNADNIPALLRMVVEDAPAPLPSSVPRDLATICLKCLRKRPSDRYATADELADELDRWRRGEPIRARPVTPVERLGRWAQRQPVLAGLSAALILSLLGGGAALWRSNRQLRAALEAAQQAERRATESLQTTLLSRLRSRRGGAVAPAHEETLRVLAGIGRQNPSLELRNDAIVALAMRDADTAGAPAPVFRAMARPSGTIKQACSLTISPDGRLLLSGSQDGLRMYDTVTGREVWSLAQTGTPWMTTHFEPAGDSFLCSARTSGIQRRTLKVTRGVESGAVTVEVSPPQTIGRDRDSTIQETFRGGRDWLVALDRNPTYIAHVELWPDGDASRASVVAKGESMTWMSLSHDGQWTASVTIPPSGVRIWNAATAKVVHRLEIPVAMGAAFTPDSRKLITRTDQEYAVWEAGSWQKLKTWPSDGAGLGGRVRFSSGDKAFAVLVNDDRIQVRRTDDFTELFTLTPPQPMMLFDMVWSPTGDAAYVMNGRGEIFAWDLAQLARELGRLGLDWTDR